MMTRLTTKRGVGLTWGNLPLLALLLPLACLGPTPSASQSPPALGGHGNTAATNFSCIGKVIGGYYADIDTGCQMFHVCTLNEKGKAHYYTFRCLAGTVFDQETRVCERADEVDCTRSESFFYLNNDLYGPGIIPSTANIRVIDEGEVRQGTLDAGQTVDIPTTTSTTTPRPPFVFPETSFTCEGKIPGGLYADVETDCAVFHICSVEPDSSIKDNKFVCGPGTVFDQSSRTCQVAAAVDCAAAPTLYYLNDRRNLPDSTSVDLCQSRALGSPLADITTGCRHYTVCQAGAGGRLVEIRMACKKDQLFSQLQKRCISAKKVQCAKETLSEILGLGQRLPGAADGRRRKRRMASLLQSHRFRRAALPPLVNLVITPGVEDARVHRALHNLAALRQWTLENARHSTFIELYALQADGDDDHYQKKSYLEERPSHDSSEASRIYQHIHRKKRDLDNTTVAEQDLSGNHTKAEQATGSLLHESLPYINPNPDDTQSVTGSILHPTTILTKTVGQKTNIFPTSTVSRQRGSSTPTIPAATQPPPVIPTTLSTFTVSPVRTSVKTTSTTTVTVSPITVTVTTTIITSAKDAPAETGLTDPLTTATATPNPTSVTTPLSTTIPSTEAADLDEIITFTPMPETTSIPEDEGASHNTEVAEAEVPTVSSTSPEESFEGSTAHSSDQSTENPQEIQEENATESASEGIPEPQELLTTTPVPLTSTPALTESSKTSQSTPTTEEATSPDANTSSQPTTSTQTPEHENTTETLNTSSTTASTNATTSPPTTESSTHIMAPSGSINVSTTGVPETSASNVSTTTQPPVTPQGTLTSDNLPKTNFTCKDKKLEQFYPDPEANCQVFHYCSPGFVKKQVLDLKFLCTGATMFDVNTQKCEDMSSVTCGQEPTTPSVNDTTTEATESTTAALNETTTQALANTTTEPMTTNTTEQTFTITEQTNKTETLNATTEAINATTEAINATTEAFNATTEAFNVTSETPTIISPDTLDNVTTTKILQVNETIDKETNWNDTKHEHNMNATLYDSLDTPVATEEIILETTTATEDPQLAEPEEETEIDLLEITTEKVTEEPITVMDQSVTQAEVVTEPDSEDESTDKATPSSITEVFTQADMELETATELGPIMHQEITEDTKTITDDSIIAIKEATQVSTVEVKTEAALGTSLDHSESVLQETSTEISVSTDVSVFSSSDSISSEASVSSDVPVSQNITTPSSVEPVEESV